LDKLEEAKQEKDDEKVLKYSKRTIRITYQMKHDAIKLVRLLGIPAVVAISEADP